VLIFADDSAEFLVQ